MQIEICVESLDSALAAQQGGATRVELCRALSEDGLTPSLELVRKVRAALTIELFVMIRPRSGDFVYSEDEYRTLQNDIAAAKALGCDGVVLGLLTPERDVDVVRTRQLVELAHPAQVTFHRAFDTVRDLDAALEAVIECGVHRILSSGGASDACAGAPILARLQAQTRGRVQLMAGGGVRPNNVAELLRITGLCAVHSALIRRTQDIEQINPMHSSEWPRISPDDVAELRRRVEAALTP